VSTGPQPASQQMDPGRASLGNLFAAFVEITLSSFGGAAAWAYRVLVEKRRWLTEREFAALWSLAQALPGPNIVNAAIFLGMQHQGARGAAVAFVGLVLVPLVVVLPIGALYTQIGHVELVRAVLRGVAVVASGLLITLGIKLAMPYRRDPWALGVAALAFAGVGLLHWPLLVVMGILLPCSVAVAWRRLR
jgi:chromate transporter